ncbi:Calreticulin family-domain-containing protein [Leucosporidium creatinivorum]|uniref:Calnexin n=1 Tax=Leucosporidium creatinivorum TaxID=106004 RepID=A0A1Y2F732_9BASI|nr:Calreticulin family-domain-containing protein [Leucosporidium creatinivorum]
MRSSVAFAAAASVASISSVAAQSRPTFTPTEIKGHFVEQFTPDWEQRWSASKATKEEKAGEVFSYVGKWSVEEPTVYPGIEGDEGLVLKTKAAHHAISAPFEAPLDPKGKTIVAQYEVKLQKGLECGGAYIKLLTDSDVGIQAEEFSDKSPFTIMFGPDRCGATNKVHFIFRHANPLTGEIEEKHLISPPAPKITKTSALYTLIVRPDQTYEIKINNESVRKGSLLEDFSPAVNPSKEIDDPEDVKPEDWVESPKITDPAAIKPEDWDEDAPQYVEDASAVKPEDWLESESATIPDPDAEKPEEWSDEDDGEWIAPAVPNPACQTAAGCGPWKRPEIANPEYKGKWFAPLIDNPLYKGVWAPKKIANPDYYEDLDPASFNKIAGVGLELWSMTEDILFDNLYIGESEADAAALAEETFVVKKSIEDAAEEADKPVTPPRANSDTAPDYTKEPLAWAQFKLRTFADKAVLDPVGAFKEDAATGAAAAVLFATLLGMLTVFFSFIIPTKKTVQQTKAAVAKKTDAVTADVKSAAEQVAEQAAPLAEKASEKVEEVKEGVRTRAGAKGEKSEEL